MAFTGSEFGDFNGVLTSRRNALRGAVVDDFSTGERQHYENYDAQPRTAERNRDQANVATSEYHAPQGAPSSGTNEYAMAHHIGPATGPGAGRFVAGERLGAKEPESYKPPGAHAKHSGIGYDDSGRDLAAGNQDTYGQPSAIDKMRGAMEDMAGRLTGNAGLVETGQERKAGELSKE
ncbi:uncharacterized protein SCHCODRAFT_02616565 [Schizophyllum commune H4-8]|uniref:Uncharacterized protein n=1 Tax=Schizophyllum commune (strain H4-8 / FGSC 9210) TaxID=578458 RepID=D8PXU2_SCHCM|nr:uncharacterized protein SCHCODRAFT_02616565 [Schizophyllum commune H4-8]KAI5897052.1 hypothetical protein SCHCODRAFT_02616565 [Schizophyllum commune H4-8]